MVLMLLVAVFVCGMVGGLLLTSTREVAPRGSNAWTPLRARPCPGTTANPVTRQGATAYDGAEQGTRPVGHAAEGVDEITSQVERLREGVEALGDLQPCEVTSVGIDMLVDAAADFLEAFRELASGILDAQGDVDTLEAAMADDEDGREA